MEVRIALIHIWSLIGVFVYIFYFFFFIQGGLPAIISLACSENTSDQKAATSTLRGLAVSPLNRAVMVEAGALDAFAAAAKCEEDVEVRREAAAGLCGLSLEPVTKLLISQHFVMVNISVFFFSPFNFYVYAIACCFFRLKKY
jgi:hypothetical protein